MNRVLVAGGGIIGLTVAATLQRAGVPVTLMDAGSVCRGASWGNAGHIATEQVYPVADPRMLAQLPRMLLDPLGPLRLDWRYVPTLLPWAWQTLRNMRPAAFRRIHESLTAFNALCLAAWQDFARDWQLQDWLKVEGSLLVGEKTKTLAQLRTHGQNLQALGIENVYLDGEALRERAPALAGNQLGGLFFPQTGHVVDIEALCQSLLASFRALGGEVREHCRIEALRVAGEDGVVATTDQGQLRASHVVLCMGAFSKPFAEQLTGVRVPLDTERGYHLMLPHEAGRLPIPVSSADRRFIMTPMAGGLRLAGTVEYAGLHAAPNMARARNLLPLAQGMLREALNVQDASPWMGFRPTTSDSLPVIDRMGNVLLAFGHQHLGLTQAPLTAQAVAALFFDRAPPLDMRPFALRRFLNDKKYH